MSRAAAPGVRGVATRSAARLAAVQALYQIEFGGGDPEQVVAEFLDRRLGAEVDGERTAAADPEFFRAVVLGSAARAAEIDPLLAEALRPGRAPSDSTGSSAPSSARRRSSCWAAATYRRPS